MNAALAAKAYSQAQGLSKGGGSSAGTELSGEASGFGDLVKSAIEQTVETGRMAEAKAAEMVTGKADIVDVVTAVAETEIAVETLVSVRDKVISAYQDIMNMPI